MRPITPALLAIAALAFTVPANAQRNLKEIPDPDPEFERKSFVVADGFEVNLFAGDPLLAKPIQMNFDPRGRLWIASSEVYPQIEPGQVANDKVIVLEDKDGDGKADSTRVFADGLLIPTGVEPGDGGAYVANSTELIHLSDTDGDGKADRKRVVLSGFGTEDTHHILHTLRWGWDGALYMNQSIYIHSHIETPWGVKRLGAGGIWRFRPETLRLDVFMRGLVNSWGHHADRWGQSFATDGAGGEGINYVLPGGYYVTALGASRIVRGLNPGSPKHCGLEIISGRHLPEAWRENMITNDFRGNRVCRFVVSDDGAGFSSREQAELIKSKHPAFRPIDVKMGPDGAIYIADWYNPIIQHGEVDFRDPRRDHVHGRIWRVTAKGRPFVEKPKLVGASVASLLERLKEPEEWTRRNAKRVLKETGARAVAPELAAWIKGLDPSDPQYEHNLLEGLWTYQTIDVVEQDLLARLLQANDPRVRAAAVRVVGLWSDRLSDPLTALAPRVVDDHPRVRLEAVRVLADLPSRRSMETALRALDKPVDRFLDYALWLTSRDLQESWLPDLQAGKFDDGGDPRRLVFALSAIGTEAAVKPLVEAMRGGKLGAEERSRAIGLIAAMGGPQELSMVLDIALADDAGEKRAILLDALADAAVRRKVVPAGDLGRLARALSTGDVAARAAAARAAGVWNATEFRGTLEQLARSEDSPTALRAAAVDGLASLGGPVSRALLSEFGKPIHPDALRLPAIVALSRLDANLAARIAAELLSENKQRDPSPIFSAFIERREGQALLALALDGKTIPADSAKIGLRLASISGRKEPKLTEALSKAGRLADASKTYVGPERDRLLEDVARVGNADKGEAIFRRNEMQCLKCHAIAGAGGQVGPGLESVGASAPVDYLLDSLIEPNKAVKENYHASVVATTDGKILTGLKIRQTDAELVLRDAEDREISIPFSAVEDQKPGGSLMPAGLTDMLTREELVDLVRFLSELGKVGPYSTSKGRIARRWRYVAPEPDMGLEIHRGGYEAIVFNSRRRREPIHSKVSGILPASEVPAIQGFREAAPVAIVETRIDVSTPGKVRLSIGPKADFIMWVDSSRVECKPTLDLDLASGSHALTFVLPRDASREGIFVEIGEVPGSPARAAVVLGK